MSDSPKYSAVRLPEEVARRGREENRRRAEERAVRRAAEAERPRKERLRQGPAVFKARLQEGKRELAAFDGTPARRRVADSLRQLLARLAQIEQKTPANEEDLARANKDLHRVQRQLKQAVAHGKAAQDAQDLEQEAATVLKWKYHAAEDRQGSRQFDPNALAQFEAALRKVEDELARRHSVGAHRAMTAVGRQFEQHRAEVEKRCGLWLTRKQASEAALARLQEAIAGLQSDVVVQRWETPGVADISERAGQVSKVIDNGQFEHATQEAEKLLVEVKRVIEAAEERECRQERQNYIAESTVKALQACGVMVDGISQSPQGASTDIVIHVHRLDGRALAVSVPQEGAIKWSVNGFPMHVEAGSNGQPATVCDEAVSHIEEVQERLDKEYGVETSTLTWAGQDPNRPRKAAKKRPRYARQYSQRTWGGQPR
ncbi:MAG: hypothetical protein ACQESR_03885 [Planctomycetota bacterium]